MIILLLHWQNSAVGIDIWSRSIGIERINGDRDRNSWSTRIRPVFMAIPSGSIGTVAGA